mgnify:CR=1
MSTDYLLLALGVFLGNWLVVPIFFKNQSRTRGFFTGLIAAGLILLFVTITHRLR